MLVLHRIARVGAVAAAFGGVAWAVKGGAILATGEQPPALFPLGPPLFAVGLVGLYARLGKERGNAAKAGLALAIVSILLGGVLLLVWALASDALPAGEDDFTPLSLVIAAAGGSLILGLVFLGVAARRARALAPRWRPLPFWAGVFCLPAIAIGGLLSELSERLLEIPLVALALAWIAIGYLIWPSGETDVAATIGSPAPTEPR